MLKRCHNANRPDYARYGGRGIRVCDAWRTSFVTFLRDVGPKPGRAYTLERINNDGDYEPGNVRWATRKEQARNSRRNVWLSLLGRVLLLDDWAKEIGIDRRTLRRRMLRGWDDEKVLTTPIGVSRRRELP